MTKVSAAPLSVLKMRLRKVEGMAVVTTGNNADSFASSAGLDKFRVAEVIL